MDHVSLYNKEGKKNTSTKKDIASTLDSPALVRCNLAFDSKSFWQIKLPYLPENIAIEDVIRFFILLDSARKVKIDVTADGYVTEDAFLHVSIGDLFSSLPISIFWRAISHECKAPVRQYTDFLKIYRTLFSLHGKVLYRHIPPH